MQETTRDTRPPTPPQLSTPWSSILNAALFLFWSGVLTLALISTVPNNAFLPKMNQQALMHSLIPQGWAFFTRDAREEWVLAYQVDGHGQLLPANNADYRGGFWNGIQRRKRNRGLVVGELVNRITDKSWLDCSAGIADCYSQAVSTPISIDLPFHDNTNFCGLIVLQKHKQKPWAWRSSHSSFHTTTRFAVANINCTAPAPIQSSKL